jgi:hypothetical protein
MRKIPAAILLLPVLVNSQRAVPQAEDGYGDAEQAVRTMLSHPSGYTGWDVKGLTRLGDASAVALTKFIRGETISNQQMNQMLLILTLSFQAPKAIVNPPDREPKTTIFLLKYLECSTADRTLREKIAETKASLLSLNTEKH